MALHGTQAAKGEERGNRRSLAVNLSLPSYLDAPVGTSAGVFCFMEEVLCQKKAKVNRL